MKGRPIPYDRFRSGLKFEDVRRLLLIEQEQAKRNGDRMFVTRRTVLGRWRQHKLSAYEYATRAGAA